MSKETKVRCPRSGCNYHTSADAAEDAMTEMKEHFEEVHGTDEVPEEVRKSLEGDIKNRARTRV